MLLLCSLYALPDFLPQVARTEKLYPHKELAGISKAAKEVRRQILLDKLKPATGANAIALAAKLGMKKGK